MRRPPTLRSAELKPEPAYPNEALRVRLSAGAETEPDILTELAADASVTVRAALALNTPAPPQANAVLAGDSD